MGDQFGRKRVFLLGLVFFTVASIAWRYRDVARDAIVGAPCRASARPFLVPGSLAIISATFDDAERGRAIGTWSGFQRDHDGDRPGRWRLAGRNTSAGARCSF